MYIDEYHHVGYFWHPKMLVKWKGAWMIGPIIDHVARKELVDITYRADLECSNFQRLTTHFSTALQQSHCWMRATTQKQHTQENSNCRCLWRSVSRRSERQNPGCVYGCTNGWLSAISPNDICILIGHALSKNIAALVKTTEYHNKNAVQKAIKPQQKKRVKNQLRRLKTSAKSRKNRLKQNK